MNPRKSLFARFGFLLTCTLLLAGCLTIPLGDPDKSTIDNKLVGWWEQPDAAADNRMLMSVRAYDSHTYLVVCYNYEVEGTTITPGATMIYKAWLTPVGTAQFLTAELMSSLGDAPTDDRKDRYFVTRIEPTTNGWTEHNVSDDFLKDCTAPDSLEQKIADNLNNGALYGSSAPIAFLKVSDDRVKELMKVINHAK